MGRVLDARRYNTKIADCGSTYLNAVKVKQRLKHVIWRLLHEFASACHCHLVRLTELQSLQSISELGAEDTIISA